MRILFVGLTDPYPPNNGHRMRDWFLLNALKREGHQVDLVAMVDTPPLPENRRALEQVCRTVVTVPKSSAAGLAQSLLGRCRALVARTPYGAWRVGSHALRSAVASFLDGAEVDLIICDDIYMLQNIPRVAVPVILNKHDITHIIVERFLARQRNPFVKAYGILEHRNVRRWELDACRAATGVLACSELDREILERLCPGLRVHVAPNIVDVDAYKASVADDGRTMLFVGAMDWYPNEDAVDFFVSDILPRVRAKRPGLRFVVAGRNPSEALRKRYATLSDVTFTGTVPDLREEIAKAMVCVVPLRIGSGTRLKILEAAAAAKAIVSTRLGAEGLGFDQNHEIVFADEPEAFAAAVASLAASPTRRRALGHAARLRVEEDYSLAVLQRAVANALRLVRSPETYAAR